MSDALPHAADFVEADTEEALLLGNEVQDNLATAFIALAAEVWANRRRTDLIEHLLQEKGVVTAEMIEQHIPSEEFDRRRDEERQAFIHRVFRSMSKDRDPSLTLASDWRRP